MSGPPRLRDSAGPAQRLLRSAALDVPSATSRRKLMAFTGTAAAGVATSGLASAGVSTLGKSVLLWVGIGSVGGGALAYTASELSQPSRPVAAEARPAKLPEAPAAEPVTALPVVPSEPPVEPAPAALSKVAPHVAPSAPSAAHAPAPSLFEELRVIESARAAAGRGDAGAALAALDNYDRSFPGGQFAPEALALRVEALASGGNGVRARELADEFARRYPRHPLRSRVNASAPP
jgi:hypothetical protein